MNCICKVLIIFLFLIMTMLHGGSIEDLEEQLRQNNIKSEKINTHKSNVYINNNKYEIFFYDTTESFGKYHHVNTLYKFYTCMNCEFATWTRSELFVFVQMFPILNNSNSDNNMFRVQFGEVVRKLDRIKFKIDRYIDILFNITKSIHSTTIDTSFLVALLSLLLKIDYMKTLHKENQQVLEKKSDDGLDPRVVKLVLKSVSDIEIFLSLNCEITTFYDNRMFNTNLINDQNEVENKGFLEEINSLNLESSIENKWSLDRMLLGNILKDSNNSLHSMIDVEIEVGCYQKILLKDLSNDIHKFHDLEIIYWYQIFILQTTMNLLCEKIKKYLDKYVLNTDIPKTLQNKFKNIIKHMFSEPIGIPYNVIEIFEKFTQKTKLTSNDVKFMKDELTLYMTELKKWVNIYKVNYSPSNNRKIDQEKLMQLLDYSLDEYLSQIELNIEEYKCFIRLYKLLNAEFYSFYAPFIMDPEKVTDVVSNIESCGWTKDDPSKPNDVYQRAYTIEHLTKVLSIVRINKISYSYDVDDNSYTTNNISEIPSKSQFISQGCEYTNTLIHESLNIIRIYNNLVVPPINDVQNRLTLALEKINIIRKALLDVVNNYPNHLFQKIGNHMIPYVDFLGEHIYEESIGDFLLRYISLLVNLLNYYGLEYCYPPEHNFLMFNESLVKTLENINLPKNAVQTFLAEIESTKKLERIDPNYKTSLWPSALNVLYDNYKMVFKSHHVNENITFLWIGERRSIAYIYKHVTSTLVGPNYLYKFFDIYLKYLLSNIFYEINAFYRMASDGITTVTDCNSFEFFDKNISVPNQFNTIFEKLQKYFKLLVKVCCRRGDNNELRILENSIVKYFNVVDVFINTMNIFYDDVLKFIVGARISFNSLYTLYTDGLNSFSKIKSVLNQMVIYTK